MTLDQATKEAAIRALTTIEDFTRAGFEHGVDRVHLYYDDIEGDWLDIFVDEESPSSILPSSNSSLGASEASKLPLVGPRRSSSFGNQRDR